MTDILTSELPFVWPLIRTPFGLSLTLPFKFPFALPFRWSFWLTLSIAKSLIFCSVSLTSVWFTSLFVDRPFVSFPLISLVVWFIILRLGTGDFLIWLIDRLSLFGDLLPFSWARTNLGDSLTRTLALSRLDDLLPFDRLSSFDSQLFGFSLSRAFSSCSCCRMIALSLKTKSSLSSVGLLAVPVLLFKCLSPFASLLAPALLAFSSLLFKSTWLSVATIRLSLAILMIYDRLTVSQCVQYSVKLFTAQRMQYHTITRSQFKIAIRMPMWFDD